MLSGSACTDEGLNPNDCAALPEVVRKIITEIEIVSCSW
jgi:hypothetical protein